MAVYTRVRFSTMPFFVVISSTWLIKGGISEIRGGISEIYHLWLTNQIAELH